MKGDGALFFIRVLDRLLKCLCYDTAWQMQLGRSMFVDISKTRLEVCAYNLST